MVNNSEITQLMEAIIHYYYRHFPKHCTVEIITQILAKLTKLKPSQKKPQNKLVFFHFISADCVVPPGEIEVPLGKLY